MSLIKLSLNECRRALVTIDKIASINNEDEKDNVLNDIYKIAHAFSGKCSHNDWKKFHDKMEKRLKDY